MRKAEIALLDNELNKYESVRESQQQLIKEQVFLF